MWTGLSMCTGIIIKDETIPTSPPLLNAHSHLTWCESPWAINTYLKRQPHTPENFVACRQLLSLPIAVHSECFAQQAALYMPREAHRTAPCCTSFFTSAWASFGVACCSMSQPSPTPPHPPPHPLFGCMCIRWTFAACWMSTNNTKNICTHKQTPPMPQHFSGIHNRPGCSFCTNSFSRSHPLGTANFMAFSFVGECSSVCLCLYSFSTSKARLRWVFVCEHLKLKPHYCIFLLCRIVRIYMLCYMF